MTNYHPLEDLIDLEGSEEISSKVSEDSLLFGEICAQTVSIMVEVLSIPISPRYVTKEILDDFRDL